MDELIAGADASWRRREELDELLSGTFNSILRIEERSLDNRLTHGLTITEVHTIVAVGLHERNPMNVVAARLGVTLATLTTAVAKLVRKGFIERSRFEDDRRVVLVSLTKKGRQVLRAHNLFHHQMIDEALADLTEEEETQVILKEIKQTKETLEMTPPDRTEIIEECNHRLSVLEQYAPKMMDESQIQEVIDATLAELGIDAPTAKDKGRIMKTLMPKVKGKADGKLVSDLVGKLF